jgi:hypothetical protein
MITACSPRAYSDERAEPAWSGNGTTLYVRCRTQDARSNTKSRIARRSMRARGDRNRCELCDNVQSARASRCRVHGRGTRATIVFASGQGSCSLPIPPRGQNYAIRSVFSQSSCFFSRPRTRINHGQKRRCSRRRRRREIRTFIRSVRCDEIRNGPPAGTLRRKLAKTAALIHADLPVGSRLHESAGLVVPVRHGPLPVRGYWCS